MDSKLKKLIFLIAVVAITGLVEAKQEALPTPLDLETALSFAKDHPRTRLSLEQQLISPPAQSLFLNCHNLSFNNTNETDRQRNSVFANNLITPVEQQKLFILQYFFDVLLADSSMIGINEDMAGAYIAYDRAKTRQEFKQYSELRVAKLEAEYQDVLQQRFSGEASQRLSRSQLAHAINHPNDLSSDLNPPSLIKAIKELPDSEEIISNALKNNRWLKELEKNNNKDQIALIKMNLRQQILELVLRLNVLNAAVTRAESESYSRDLDLEMSRSLYEMEVKASLGRSMTLQSKARMQEERINYCVTLAWAQLNALQGQDILTQPQVKKEPSE